MRNEATSRYVAMTKDESNAADAVPAQAGIDVFQRPAKVGPLRYATQMRFFPKVFP